MSKTKIVLSILGGLLAFVALYMVLSLTFQGLRFWDSKLDTQYEQYNDKAVLKKYELFKNMAAQLSATKASIGVLDSAIKNLESQYTGVARKDWPKDDRIMWGQKNDERSAIILGHNELAGQYNSAMAKDNYRFANTGMMPNGATEPLAREYAAYITGKE